MGIVWALHLVRTCILGGMVCVPAMCQIPPPVLGKLIEVAGHRLHLYCTGNGTPAVIVASGGFSFDWGLIQPEIARHTQICTYDTAGTAWSDHVPDEKNRTCTDRVTELHELLRSAGVHEPYILVGYSIGGLIARLYAAEFPNEIAGMVLVDHAFVDTPVNRPTAPPPSGRNSPPVLVYQTPILLDFEDDENFSRLPAHDQALHRWALPISVRPTPEMAEKCFSEVARAEGSDAPLGEKALAVVSIPYDSEQYLELQRKLLSLSRNSRQFVADHSTHMVLIDQPETVIEAIEYVLAATRK
ncbi:MAG TPA: alpha/beta hydrolase [Bryobacteraceae bacterium]|nr:alpha/beta hydrolase [Bryobacteraceae bacterium]